MQERREGFNLTTAQTQCQLFCRVFCAYPTNLAPGCPQVYGNQLAGNAGGSLLGGILQQPTGVVCGNKVQNDEDYEGDPLTMECPDYVRISLHVERVFNNYAFRGITVLYALFGTMILLSC